MRAFGIFAFLLISYLCESFAVKVPGKCPHPFEFPVGEPGDPSFANCNYGYGVQVFDEDVQMCVWTNPCIRGEITEDSVYAKWDCEKMCLKYRDPAKLCKLPPVRGSSKCGKDIPMFSYDHHTHKCVRYSYAGCGETGNLFNTKEDCEKMCSGV